MSDAYRYFVQRLQHTIAPTDSAIAAALGLSALRAKHRVDWGDRRWGFRGAIVGKLWVLRFQPSFRTHGVIALAVVDDAVGRRQIRAAVLAENIVSSVVTPRDPLACDLILDLSDSSRRVNLDGYSFSLDWENYQASFTFESSTLSEGSMLKVLRISVGFADEIARSSGPKTLREITGGWVRYLDPDDKWGN
ncbi:hypothetical protein [Stratiformator vulcanicus]|uniref:hypothetical protein n=1 Tax=Stratiformator vulcanicus TaxID=2527980 RepID=UPI0011A6D323|nr:hypothetical protein [Stratiformator vulcanicus]